MYWQFTPYVIPLLIAAVISLTLALYAWQRRWAAPAAASFAMLMLAVAEWSVGYALELGGAHLPAITFWAKVEYLGIATSPLAWLVFALQFANQDKWLTRRNLGLLAVVPIITLLLVWTNEAHGLVWSRVDLDTSGPFPAMAPQHGLWFWVHSAFSYTCLLLGTILLIRMVISFPDLYRWQAGLMLLAVLAPWISNGLYLSRLGPFPYLDLTSFAFTLTGLAAGWNLFRFRFLDVVPIARRAVVEGMRDGVIVLDGQNRIVDFNPAAQQLIGQPAAAIMGRLAGQVLAGRADLIERYRDVLEASSEIVLGAGETRRYFDLRISPLYDRHNRLNGRLIVLRDITERKQAEVELAQARDQALEASRLKTELLAKVSHELRTPLNAILGFAELLEIGIYDPISEKQKSAVSEIIDSAHNLTNLVNDLLDQAKLDAGKLELHLTSFAPADILKKPLSKLEALAYEKSLNLTAEIAAEVPPVLTGDPVRLQQILVNLISNAVKFTQTGAVQVRLDRPDVAHWSMQVADTGIGIPHEAQAHIFEPFGQVDGSMTREYAGTGLGLSMVKQLANLMGGEVILESEVGRGSTFTVLLPLPPREEEIV